LINPLLEKQEKVYVLLNKPRGYLTALADTEGRPLVTELVPQSLGRLHPVGRLDFNTEGLLILTNDGELTNHITAARNHVRKVYEVKVKGVPPEGQVARLRRGIRLDDGVRTAPAQVKKVGETETNTWYEVVLEEGRNQQIRKMFDAIGHSVLKLRRVKIGPIEIERLPTGKWRHLTPAEVARLKGTSAKRMARGAASAKVRGKEKSFAGERRGVRKGGKARGAGHGGRGV
jgi:23S rRNA pseudouridine2605 synthase